MDKLICYLDKRAPIWSDIGKLGENKTVRSSAIWMFVVPVLARILDTLNELNFSLGTEVLKVSLSLPFSWIYLYFAALFFGIGSILYLVWCPRFIRTYDSYNTLDDQGKGSRTIIDNLTAATEPEKAYSIKATRVQVLWQFVTDYMTDVRTTKNVEPDIKKLTQDLFNGKIRTDCLREAFWFVRNFCEEISPVKRLLVSVLYFLGFVCLAIIVAENTCSVISTAFLQTHAGTCQ